MLSESKRSAALMHFFLLVRGGIGLRDGEDDLAVGFVHISSTRSTPILNSCIFCCSWPIKWSILGTSFQKQSD